MTDLIFSAISTGNLGVVDCENKCNILYNIRNTTNIV